MTDSQELLREKFSAFLRWNRALEREGIWIRALFHATLISLLLFPVKSLFPLWFGFWLFPSTFFFILVPVFWLRRGQVQKSNLKTVLRLDRALALEERGITAWEILGQARRQGAELLVLEEARSRLGAVEPRSVLERNLPWQAWGIPPLLLLWGFLVWSGFEVRWDGKFAEVAVSSVAETLKRFSHEIKERARREGLKRSFEVAESLEKTAEKRLRGELGEKELRERIAAVEHTITRKLPGSKAEGGSRLFGKPGGTGGGLMSPWRKIPQAKDLPTDLLGNEAGHPELEEGPLDDLPAPGAQSEGEFDRRSEGLDRSASEQMDQRTLAQIQQFLKSLLDQEEGSGSMVEESANIYVAGSEKSSSQERRSQAEASVGDQPGLKELAAPSPPGFRAEAATHLRGLIGKGRTRALQFRAEPREAESQVQEESLLTSYQKQMEVELASEAIPDALKDPIKNYFVSLGLGTQGGEK